jgi:hypothetical protein
MEKRMICPDLQNMCALIFEQEKYDILELQ